jgi:hypothetical protein
MGWGGESLCPELRTIHETKRRNFLPQTKGCMETGMPTLLDPGPHRQERIAGTVHEAAQMLGSITSVFIGEGDSRCGSAIHHVICSAARGRQSQGPHAEVEKSDDFQGNG